MQNLGSEWPGKDLQATMQPVAEMQFVAGAACCGSKSRVYCELRSSVKKTPQAGVSDQTNRNCSN